MRDIIDYCQSRKKTTYLWVQCQRMPHTVGEHWLNTHISDLDERMKLHHAFADSTAISVTGHNNLLSPAPTTDRKTNAVDISGGTCLHLNHWPPLHQ
jgi:hypothetical protein